MTHSGLPGGETEQVIPAAGTDIQHPFARQRPQMTGQPVPFHGAVPLAVQWNAENLEGSLSPGFQVAQGVIKGCGLVVVKITGCTDANSGPVDVDRGGVDIGQALQDLGQGEPFLIGAEDRLVSLAHPLRQFSQIGSNHRIPGEGIQLLHLVQTQEQKLNHLSQTSMPENPQRRSRS
jgi:hypothetical protein